MIVKQTQPACRSCAEATYANGLCRSCYERQLRRANPDYRRRQLENRRAWGKRNPDRLREHQQRRVTDPRLRARDAATKRRAYLRRLRITEERLRELRNLQGNCCAICERDLHAVGAEHIDHDHIDGGIRGLLCSRCNNGLGMFGDGEKLLAKAIEYLKHPPALPLRSNPTE